MPVLAVLAVLLVRRKAPKEFPFFFSYIIVGVVVGVVRLCLYSPRSIVYIYAYWITDVLIAIVALLATYELFVRRLFPRFHAVRFYRYLFPITAVIIALCAVPAALQLNRLGVIIRSIHVFEFLRVAILLFFVGLMLLMGRRWTRHEFGIALGLGIQASAVLLTSASWTQGARIRTLTVQLPVIAYDIACLIWLVTFLQPEKFTPPPTRPVSPEVLGEARKWQETLKESLTSKKNPD